MVVAYDTGILQFHQLTHINTIMTWVQIEDTYVITSVLLRVWSFDCFINILSVFNLLEKKENLLKSKFSYTNLGIRERKNISPNITCTHNQFSRYQRDCPSNILSLQGRKRKMLPRLVDSSKTLGALFIAKSACLKTI